MLICAHRLPTWIAAAGVMCSVTAFAKGGECKVPGNELTDKHRAAIESQVLKKMEWTAQSYTLERLADWDRVPVWAANSKEVMTGFAPLYVPLPSGELVSAWDEQALQKILAGFFATPRAADAKTIARLSTRFGRFEQPVGDVVEHFPEPPQSRTGLPRESPQVVYEARADKHKIDFYAYNFERMRLFDCRVRIDSKSKTVAVEATQVMIPEVD